MDPTYQAALALVPQPYAAYLASAVAIYCAVCTVASVIDASFPPPPAGSVWVGPRNVIHVLALNKGHAANALPAGAVPASMAEKVTEVQEAASTLAQAAGEAVQRAEGKPEAVKTPQDGGRVIS